MAPEGSKSLGPAVSPGSAYLQQLEGRGPCDESWPSPGPTVIRGSSPSSPSTGSQRRKPCPGCLPHVSNTVSLDPAPPDSAPEIPSGYLTRRTTLQLRVKGSQGTITWKSPSHVLTLTQEKFDLLSLASVSFTCKMIKLFVRNRFLGEVLQSCMYSVQFVQSLSRVWLFATPWTTVCQASLSITNSRSLPTPMSIESMMPSNHLIFCCPLLLLPSIFPSISVFSNQLAVRIRLSKYWSFSFNISLSNEHLGLISFRMDWLDLLIKYFWIIGFTLKFGLPWWLRQ